MFNKILSIFNKEKEEIHKKTSDECSNNTEALEKVNKFNKAILHVLPHMLFVVKRDGFVIDAQCAKGAFLREPSFYIGKNLSETFEVEVATAFLNAVADIKDEDGIRKIDMSCVINNRTEYGTLHVSCLSDDEIIVFIDRTTDAVEQLNYITQYQAEIESQNEILNQSNEKAEKASAYSAAILNALPQMLMVVTREGQITDAQCAKGAYLREPSFYVGKTLREAFDTDEVESLLAGIKYIEVTDEVQNVEISCLVNGNREYFVINVVYFTPEEVLILVNRTTTSVEQLNYISQYKGELESQNEILNNRKLMLEKANAYNEAIINALPQMLMVVTRQGLVLDAQCAKGSYIREPKFYLDKNLGDVFEAKNIKDLLEIIQNIEVKDEVQKIEISCMINDRKEYLNMHVVHFTDEEVLVLANRVTELREQLNTIRFLSHYDQVTGLCNRRCYEEKLYESILSRNYPLSVIVADINGLKLVNDAFGHPAGDKLLTEFADAMKSVDVDEDFISRTGGDEFAIILPGKDEFESQIVIDAINENCKDRIVNGVVVSASFGIGTVYNEEQSIHLALQIAEDKMYQEKLLDHATKRDNTIRNIHKILYTEHIREKEHNDRVVYYSKKIAEKLGLPNFEKNKVEQTALFHDIGKIGIPEKILNKTDVLTEEEYKEICKHSEIGYRILKSAEDLKSISESVLLHHEHWDGTGYPKGIQGEEIPLESRIVAIVDAFEIMTKLESNREKISIEEAIEELQNSSGTKYEPKLVEAFIEILNEERK